jgi:biotin carboxyl carrier protein
MSDAPLAVCPACGASTYVKQVTAAGFQLKGSGWYVTDFRGGNTGASAEKPAEGDAAAKPEKGDAKPADAKPAAASPAAAPAPTPAASTTASSAPAAGKVSSPSSGTE